METLGRRLDIGRRRVSRASMYWSRQNQGDCHEQRKGRPSGGTATFFS
jgi:hypothetical protein